MRRLVICAAIVVALNLNVASADIRGSRAEAKATHRCQQIAKHLNRRGLTPRERAYLIRVDCKQLSDGSWATALFFTA